MNMEKSQPARSFNARAFTATAALISGLTLPVSGIANHMLQTDPMTTARHIAMAAHNGLALLFVVSTCWHIVLNRRALLAHLKGVHTGLLGVAREVVWACLVVALLLFLMVGHALLLAGHGPHS